MRTFFGPWKEVARPMPERTLDSRQIQGVLRGVFCRFGTDGPQEPTRSRPGQGRWHQRHPDSFIGSLADPGGVAPRGRVVALAECQHRRWSVAVRGLDSGLGLAGPCRVLLGLGADHRDEGPPTKVQRARSCGRTCPHWAALGHSSSGCRAPVASIARRRDRAVLEFARPGKSSR